MSSLTTTLRSIGLLAIALTLALIANFAYGQWANPTVAPTGGNVAVPVNVGNSYQDKAGDLGVGRLRTDQFCDSTGTQCFDVCDVISCTPTYSSCTLDGVTVPHSSSRTFYSLTSTTGSCTWYDQIRTCNNGTLNGSTAYQYASCSTVTPPPPPPPPPPTYSNCTLNGVTVAHGSSRRFYSRTSATNCMSYDQIRTCSNGTLNGSTAYQYASCSTVTPPPPPPSYSGCNVNGTYVAHGSSRTFYSRTSAPYCSSYAQVRTCNNGTMNGSTAYQYTSCVSTPPCTYWGRSRAIPGGNLLAGSNRRIYGTLQSYGGCTYTTYTCPSTGGPQADVYSGGTANASLCN